MRVAAFAPASFIDYPGKVASVVFTPGCNLRCWYCHNRALIDADNVRCATTRHAFLSWLENRRGLLDGVVLGGGEPALQPGLLNFVEEVHRLGFAVKLDTNGTRPDVLAPLLDRGLLDYVAMDIKAPVNKYEQVCGVAVDAGAIDESIGLLLHSRVAYEFRTTVIPQLTRRDLLEIGQRIQGARQYVLQRYRPPESAKMGREVPSESSFHGHADPWIAEVLDDLLRVVTNSTARGFGRG